MNLDAIISETTFVGCENLPADMARKLDRPWMFLGETTLRRDYMQACCTRCNPKPPVSLWKGKNLKPPEFREAFVVVFLKRYIFVTDDRLEVGVFFGCCRECGQSYWARQGPPFRRARRYVPEFLNA